MQAIRLMIAAAIALSACSTASRPNFEAALAEHLRTIAERDLSAYEQTITAGDDLSIIFPNGHRTATRQEALAFHAKWFGDTDWQMRVEETERIDLEDVVIVLLHTFYRDQPDGEDREAWLTLTFALQDGAWRLVFDQNTRIAPASE